MQIKLRKNNCILVFVFLFCIKLQIFGQHNRDYLQNAFSQFDASKYFAALQVWRSNQHLMLSSKIMTLPDSLKKNYIDDADKALSYKWPLLAGSLYLKYKFLGNRSDYENMMYERRIMLNKLVIGEMIAHNKKYIPQIADGLWAVLEESSWVWPAHLSLQKIGVDLPDPEEDIIDLGAGETASNVAAILFMLRRELEDYSPAIPKRITYELSKKIITPYLERNDFWWMGFGERQPNNWNPWINTNVLYTALYTEQDSNTLLRVLNKINLSADKFINAYPEDGSCDEGAEYWGEAGGKLIRLLTLLNDASGGQIHFENYSLFHRMGSYISKVYIGKSYFINFADADKVIPRAESIYNYGEMFDDDSLKRFAAYVFKLSGSKLNNSHLVDFLEAAKVYDSLVTITANPLLPPVSWFSNLQVLACRSKEGSDKGLYFAAQGGHNAESHNHNDVGNFILYVDGNPVIIDAGVGEYTSKTFSSERYQTWNLQSQWHNCPLINGVQQKDGRQYEATNVIFNEKHKMITLSMDIAKAYPSEAAVNKWQRNFVFNPLKQELSITENYRLNEWKTSSKIYFLTNHRVKKINDGLIGFEDTDGKMVLKMQYDEKNMDSEIETNEITDKVLLASWGKQLYRLALITKGKSLSGANKYIFSIPK